VDFVDHADERGDGQLTDNFIGVMQTLSLRDHSAPMAGKNVRVRLVENVRVRRLLTYSFQQLEIG
jgi:hypothetical protein